MNREVALLIKDTINEKRKTLDLTGHGIDSYSEELLLLEKCTHLETIILNQDRIQLKHQRNYKQNYFNSIPITISKLRRLKELIIVGDYDNKFEINEITNLPNSLEVLKINNAKVDTIDLKGLRLTSLDLSYNNLKEIKELSNTISYLNIESNNINSFGGFENNLYNLKFLNISNNNFSYLDTRLFPNLEILICSSNKIKGVLNVTSKIKLINASINKIEKIIYSENSSNEVLINIFSNEISFLPIEFFHTFDNHKFVEIDIKGIVSNLVKIQNYEEAADMRDLQGQVSRAVKLNKDRLDNILKWITYQNKISSPPYEIITQGSLSVRNWFESLRGFLKDVKIVVLGEPDSGKTSLINRLFYDKFNENEDQTDGINILEIDFKYNKYFKENTKIHDVTGRIWDFGGQDILNSTHNCFLTKRSIYIVCLDSRIDTKVSSQIRRWAKKVKVTAGESQIIVLVNKIDKNPGFQFDNEKDIQKEFPSIIRFLRVSCLNNVGIDDLRSQLETAITTNEIINTEIDQNWILLKNKLLNNIKGKKYISEEMFNTISNEIVFQGKADKLNSVKFLNDLGIITHFSNTWIPKFYVFDPLWITYGLYQIITSQLAANNFGTVIIDQLHYIVNEEEDKTKPYNIHDYYKVSYDRNEVNYLMEVLLAFKLAYLSFNRDVLIIPDLLNAKEPDEVQGLFDFVDLIEIEYRFEFLPSNVLIELLISLNSVLFHSWRTGFVFKIDNNYCSVHSYDNSIFIKTSKNVKASESITIVRHHLSQIINKLTEQPKILVPLPDKSFFVDLQELIGRLNAGEPKFIIYTPKVVEYEITKLLYGFELEPKFDTVLNKLKIIEEGQTKLFDQFSSFEEKLSQNLKNYVKDIKDDISNQNSDLFDSPSEQSTLMSKVDEILQELKMKPEEELWHDKEPTTKLKAVIPLIIFRYEKELDISNMKMPKTWQEFKAWFLKQK